ncbi:MAG: TrmH family RNA methyltransferase, partial [Pseudomonadota bacterium]
MAKTPVIVLVYPQMGENIGMCARSMGNFGLKDLRIVKARDGWPQEQARLAAAHGAYIIDRAIYYDDLAAATQDCHHLYALSAR